jgi:spore germination protein
MLYIVRPGDSLFSIARRFNVPAEGISELNNLSGATLYVGQRLRIPLYTEVIINTATAFIRSGPGENHAVIARMVRTTRLPVLSSVQGFYRVRLYNGNIGWISKQVVTLRAHDGSKPITEIVAFYSLKEGPSLPSSFTSFVDNTAQISQTSLFFYRISADNPTQIERFGTFSDQDNETLVAISHRNNIKILPIIHNLLYKQGGTNLAKRVVKTLVSNPQNRRAFIQNVIGLIERYNFDGVTIDIEDVFIEDSRNLSLLYAELGMALHRRGYFLSASIPARIRDYPPFNPFSDPFNYGAIGMAVDQFIVMLYNEHGWPGSGPGAVVSIGWMEKVLRYSITKMPKEKIIAAVSVFGFDFNLTTKVNTYVTHSAAIMLAQKYNATVVFDQESKTPKFSYTDERGNHHEVWFENAESIKAKVQLAWDLGIAGVALWRLGMEDPAIWTMLANDVVVKKF